MKGSSFYGHGNQSPLAQKKGTTIYEGKEFQNKKGQSQEDIINMRDEGRKKAKSNVEKMNKHLKGGGTLSKENQAKIMDKQDKKFKAYTTSSDSITNVNKKIFSKKAKNEADFMSGLKQKAGTQASKAKKVVARNTSGKDMLKYNDPQDISATQTDKKGNKFVVSLKDNESYSGFDDNPVTTSRKGFKDFDFDVDRTSPRDTFVVSKNYPHGSLVDETEMQTGKAQKKGFQPRKKNY